jgi:hypothetical protein
MTATEKAATTHADYDDYSLRKVPESEIQPTRDIALARMGFTVSASDLAFGYAMGLYFSFWMAIWLAFLYSLIVAAVSVLMGVIAIRERTSFALLLACLAAHRRGFLPSLLDPADSFELARPAGRRNDRRMPRCLGRSGERLHRDVRIGCGKRYEVIRVTGEHDSTASFHGRRDHVRVGQATRVRLRAAEDPADQAGQRTVGITDPDSSLTCQAGVYRLVVTSAPVKLCEDDRGNDHVSVHERRGSHGGPYLLLPPGGTAAKRG